CYGRSAAAALNVRTGGPWPSSSRSWSGSRPSPRSGSPACPERGVSTPRGRGSEEGREAPGRGVGQPVERAALLPRLEPDLPRALEVAEEGLGERAARVVVEHEGVALRVVVERQGVEVRGAHERDAVVHDQPL